MNVELLRSVTSMKKEMPSTMLTSEDLKMMKKCGFCAAWIQRAKEYGNSKIGSINLIWNIFLVEPSDYFYEITRHAFPIGRDSENNLIYVADVTSADSKIGLLDFKRMRYVTVFDSFDDFIEDVGSMFPVKFFKSVSANIPSKKATREPVRFNIVQSEIGDLYDFLPFGENTRGSITRRVGEYTAIYEDSATSLKKRRLKDRIFALLLVFFQLHIFS